MQIFTFLTLDHSNLLYRPIVHQVVRRDEMVMSAYQNLRDCHHTNLAIRVQVAIHLDYDMVRGNRVLNRGIITMVLWMISYLDNLCLDVVQVVHMEEVDQDIHLVLMVHVVVRATLIELAVHAKVSVDYQLATK